MIEGPELNYIWNVPAIALDEIFARDAIYSARWLNEKYVVLFGQLESYWLDTVTGTVVEEEALGLRFKKVEEDIPLFLYTIRCYEDGLELYRTDDLSSISTLRIDLPDCEIDERSRLFTSRTEDQSALSFVLDGNVYVWETDGSETRIVGTTFFSKINVPWSPNGERLVVRDISPTGSLIEHTYHILYRDGRPMVSPGVEIGGRAELSPSWVTDEIIVDHVVCGFKCSVTSYYEAISGELLTEHFYYHWDLDQYTVYSPDGKWIFIDQTSLYSSSEVTELHYILFDLEEKIEKEFLVGSLVDFLWWAEDSSNFTFTVQPFWRNFEYEPGKYGLMSFEIATGETHVIIPDAVHIAPAPDQTKYLAVLLDADQPQSGALKVALFDADGEHLSTEQFYAELSEEVLFPDSIKGFIQPGTWSNDGTKVIYSNEKGEFWLLDETGKILQLSAQSTIEDWPYGVKVFWSPEDKQAVIQHSGKAWLITIP
ncbi:MAG: hypothetical protein DWQ07_19405 [Chloroflexi bacterium]|nr:MAG: hypothetical protein DWQ07_19405 [Chloroflexota bacterium]